jgi:hypothetical protein
VTLRRSEVSDVLKPFGGRVVLDQASVTEIRDAGLDVWEGRQLVAYIDHDQPDPAALEILGEKAEQIIVVGLVRPRGVSVLTTAPPSSAPMAFARRAFLDATTVFLMRL